MEVKPENTEVVIRNLRGEGQSSRADYVEMMARRIETLELDRIGTNRLLQAIADELGCEPNSDILTALAKLSEEYDEFPPNPYILTSTESERLAAQKRAA